ncbi:ANTAR domain-containing protein [Actinoplanes sp. NPDC049548]|uniref:GAF and ANTAR domain-containing protein n=1 Tax=Actinoplanes sp. NPDC049548 TaxID=3155152 RepID=UPI003439C607
MSAPQRSTGRRLAARRRATSTDASDPRRLDTQVRSTPEATISIEPVAGADDVTPRRRRRRGLRGSAKTRRPVSGKTSRGRGAEPAAPHPVEMAGLLHELSVRLLGADDVPQALDRLAAFVAAALPATVRCSVALIGEGGPPTLAASGPQGLNVDDLQYATGDGPALEAARTRTVVTVHDLAADARWPELAGQARAEGVHGVASVPLDIPRSAVGSVTFFTGRPGGVDAEALLTAMAVVNQAEVLVGEVHRREALREGTTVDRAAGVIIAQRGCGVREAYDVLRDTAQRLGLPREEVAERLIAAAARNADG